MDQNIFELIHPKLDLFSYSEGGIALGLCTVPDSARSSTTWLPPENPPTAPAALPTQPCPPSYQLQPALFCFPDRYFKCLVETLGRKAGHAVCPVNLLIR